MRAFRSFPNPRESAVAFLNVTVSENVCPELEARLDLMQPPKKPKRRFSQFSTKPNQVLYKKRRLSVPFERLVEEDNGVDFLEDHEEDDDHNQSESGRTSDLSIEEQESRGYSAENDDDAREAVQKCGTFNLQRDSEWPVKR